MLGCLTLTWFEHELVFAQLAVFFSAVLQPLYQTEMETHNLHFSLGTLCVPFIMKNNLRVGPYRNRSITYHSWWINFILPVQTHG